MALRRLALAAGLRGLCTERLIDLETHQEVFGWILALLAKEKLIKGKTVGIDATTLEANAAMRSIVRNDSGQSYQEFLAGLAKASGIDTPRREDLARIDKQRKSKASNHDWHNPHEPDAKIAKMKDGRTHLAHKDEQAVDEGDTITWRQTVEETYQNLNTVREDAEAAKHVHANTVKELVQDKGYHSNQTMADYQELGIRSYVSEPDRGRRRWSGNTDQRQAVYANRRRIRGERGKRLMRRRGELIERSFAHVLETGGMRRTHLRGHTNILKRMLVHVGGFNLGLVMRKHTGLGKPRRWQGLFSFIFGLLAGLWNLLAGFVGENRPSERPKDHRARFLLAA